MQPAAMQFTGICLITDDVPGLVRFYESVLGLRASGSDQHAEFTFGGPDDSGLGLAIFTWAGVEAMAPGCRRQSGTGSLTIGIRVADVDAACARVEALGIPILKPPATYPWGARSVWFRDPDGNIVDFWMKVT